MSIKTKKNLLLSSFLLYALYFVGLVTSAGDPEKISLHAKVVQMPAQGTSQSQTSGQLSHEKITIGRLKPISSPGSPRFQEASESLGIGSHNKLKGVSHIGVLSDPSSNFNYPKATVRAGKKDSVVINQFHYHSTANTKPYEYMKHQYPDQASDLKQPSSLYKVGYRKVNKNSASVQHAVSIANNMSKSQYHPKAAIFHNLPGDKNANRKRPTIDIDPGRLHGHILTTVYGPESPPKDRSVIDLSRNRLQTIGQSQTSHSHSPSRSPRSPTRDRTVSPGGGNGNKKQRVE